VAVSALRVALVDDHRLFRAGVRAELGDAVEVVGEAGTVAEAVELVVRTQPDVVLLDVHMPDGGGRAVLAGVGRQAPGTTFLALSVSDAAEDVIGVIRGGARGYVTKSIGAAELADAVRRVADGDAVFSPRLAGFVLDAFASSPAVPDDAPAADQELDRLTARERDVLRLIARATPTRRSPRSCSSPARPSRPTCRRCCASCSCRTAASSPAGRPTVGSSDRLIVRTASTVDA
jgi:DNA-binding NarL/FixJ family response regulator